MRYSEEHYSETTTSSTTFNHSEMKSFQSSMTGTILTYTLMWFALLGHQTSRQECDEQLALDADMLHTLLVFVSRVYCQNIHNVCLWLVDDTCCQVVLSSQETPTTERPLREDRKCVLLRLGPI